MSQLDLLPDPDPAWRPLEIPPDLSVRRIYIGTSGYHFDDWVGRFYPPPARRRRAAATAPSDVRGVGAGTAGAMPPAAFSGGLSGGADASSPGASVDGPVTFPRAEKDKLLFYQRYFSFLEINQTFYREPVIQTFLDIERRSRPGMLYAVKVHQDISHPARFDPERGRQAMRRHVEAVAPLLETGRFYSFLIQLEDRVERNRRALDYLMHAAAEAVRARLDVHIEFRNRTWHQESVLQTLKDCGVGICNTEIPPVPHAFPLKAYATTGKGYVRYSGLNLASWRAGAGARSPREKLQSRNARYDYLYSEAEMRERVQKQLALLEKVEAMAVAFNNHYRISAVVNAVQNARLLGAELGG